MTKEEFHAYCLERINKAKQIDLFSYLERFEPNELVKLSGGEYCTKEHDSLKISNGKWNWHSQGIGGRSAFDYLVKVRGMGLLEAANEILGKPDEFLCNLHSRKNSVQKPKKKTFCLPPIARDSTEAVSYLCNRGIDFEIVADCIKQKRLYQSYIVENGQVHDVVAFIGYDSQDIPRFASMRGLSAERYMRDQAGSDKSYAFCLPAGEPSNILHLYESCIDMLSDITLEKARGHDWQSEHHLPLIGIYQPKREMEQSKKPDALVQYFRSHPEVDTLVTHFDNDRAGRLATKLIFSLFQYSCEVIDKTPPIPDMDCNSYLQYLITKQKKREIER